MTDVEKENYIIRKKRTLNKIEEISDPFTRLLFELRIISEMSWRDVAQNMGGGNTEGSVRVYFYRYNKEHNIV